MNRTRWIVVSAVLAVALIAAGGLAGNSLGRYLGWGPVKRDPQELAVSLREHYRVMKPDGDGPFPTGLLFSGCDGPKDNMLRWAQMLNRNGWAAVIVDSHAPRNLQDHELWRLVCAGQMLFGSERAGDVLVALGDARMLPFVDPGRIVLIGASHGGWAIMDLLAMESVSALPAGLSSHPQGISPGAPLQGVIGQILVYPYCGIANQARVDGWSHPAPTLFLLAAEDSITPSRYCLDIVKLLEHRGLPVETMVFEGVNHGFDQQERSALSPLRFDPGVTQAALERTTAWLGALPGDGAAPVSDVGRKSSRALR